MEHRRKWLRGSPSHHREPGHRSAVNYTPYQPNPASLAAYPGTGDACSTYGNRNFFYLFLKNFGSTGGGKPDPDGSGTVSATGPDVTIPNNPNVTPAVAGRSITAPNAAIATGLAAGFNALGLPYVWGGGGGGAGPGNGFARGGGDYNSCGSEIGFDCSGLTAYVIGQAGFTARTTPAANEPPAPQSPGSKGNPGTSSASPATSPSTWAPSTAPAASWKPSWV